VWAVVLHMACGAGSSQAVFFLGSIFSWDQAEADLQDGGIVGASGALALPARLSLCATCTATICHLAVECISCWSSGYPIKWDQHGTQHLQWL
jgi:hypothetical protein